MKSVFTRSEFINYIKRSEIINLQRETKNM